MVNKDMPISQPWGYSWRSSTPFIVLTISTALFCDLFLYGFVVPMLPYILETRVGVDKSSTQQYISLLLAVFGLTTILSALIVGIWADRLDSRKVPLLVALVGILIGAVLFAMSRSITLLFISRVIQAASGAIAWTVGFATLADTVDPKNMGKTMGMASIAVSLGSFSGPMVSGTLLQLAGYWPTWSVIIVILMVDLILRIVMIENPKRKRESKAGDASEASDCRHSSTSSSSSEPSDVREDAPLLGSKSPEHYANKLVEEKKGLRFYTYMISQRRIAATLFCMVIFSIMSASFNTTLPLHVSRTFGWQSLATGMMFLALQGPGVILNPLFGWLRDRSGNRVQVAAGAVLVAPLLFLLGIPGDDRLAWIDAGSKGQATYIVCLIGIGCTTSLFSSFGTVEIGWATADLESEHPGIFGKGANSRMYSITNLAWTSGMLLGPLISGGLAQHAGYFEMNAVIAGSVVVAGIVAAVFLPSPSHLT